MSSTTEAPTPEATESESNAESKASHQPLPEVLTADEVAALLRISRKSVYTWFRKGEIPGGRRLGTALRFSRERVLKWLFDGQERVSRSPRGVR